ncbi:MAG: M23 family metallopeptidase [Sphingomicrobium sp.]
MHRSILFLLACVAAAPLSAQSLMPDQVVSTIIIRPLALPNPVLGSDNRKHLAFELLVTNPSKDFITIEGVTIVGPDGADLSSQSGAGLTDMTKTFAGSGNRMGPGEARLLFQDVSFPADAPMPAAVSPRLTILRAVADASGKPGPYPTDAPFPARATFTGAPIAIQAGARVIDAPLRGAGWLAGNGCCDTISSHRGALLPVDGQLFVPERFAIDWLQMDRSGRLFTGDSKKLQSYVFYGATVHSVADGVVVNAYDQADEQVPVGTAKGVTPANIGGNMLVVDIGGGAFAFYAHLQRGSLKAKIGDRVKTGEVLGLLGNTGNTDAPHLHFHLMDGPVPIASNGLPFVLRRFSSQGFLPDSQIDALFEGKVAVPDGKGRGVHSNELPLNSEVVDFDAPPGG